MPSKPGFAVKVKGIVRENFNQSIELYRSFEEKHRFFYALTLKLAAWMEIAQGSLVLDVGCGHGVSCEALRDVYQATIHGIDLSEGMIEEAKRRLQDPRIHLTIGDGEHLLEAIQARNFDAVMYNASVFVFPDPGRSFEQAKHLLQPGGVIGFSFYPRIYSPEHPDLLAWAFEKRNLPPPRFRTITSWEKACQALKGIFGNLNTTTYEMPGEISFLVDFFSIPAQSASLFPKLPYKTRAAEVRALFGTLKEWEGKMTIGWDLAKAQKERS